MPENRLSYRGSCGELLFKNIPALVKGLGEVGGGGGALLDLIIRKGDLINSKRGFSVKIQVYWFKENNSNAS